MKINSCINSSQPQGALHCFLLEPSIYISMLVSLDGEITTKELTEAVEKVYTQNETTMSKIVLDNGKVFFQKLPQTGCKVFVEQRSWREIMHESEKNTFRINEGELVRSYIIPENQGCSLLVMAHHIMGDGMALIMLLQDILCNLTGKEVEYRPLNREGIEQVPSDLKLPFFESIGIKNLNTMWEKNSRIFTWQDYYDIHEKFWSLRESDIQFEVIEKEEINEIKAVCKKQDITVNSYMVAKLLQRNPEYANFCCPISLRGNNQSISNRVALLKMPYKYNKKKTFLENAKEVHKIIRSHIEDRNKKYYISMMLGKLAPTLLDSALMYTYGGYDNPVSKLIAAIMGYVGDRKTHLSVTNLQKVDLKTDYERFQLKGIAFMAACMSATKDVACISTFQDKMTISYCNIKGRK